MILCEIFNDLNQLMIRFLITYLILFLSFSLFAKESPKFRLQEAPQFIETFPTGYKFKDFVLGGLSDLSCEGDQILAISDDRGKFGPLRIFEFKKNNFLKINNVFKIGDLDPSTDFEGLAKVGKYIFATSEGQIKDDSPIESYLFKFDLKGKLIKKFSFPSPYKIAKTHGVRDNSSFESLTYNKKDNVLITALENSLIQDDHLPNSEAKTDLRILKFDILKEQFTHEVYYQLEKLRQFNSKKVKGSLGLVAFEHLRDNYYLSLERAWIPEEKKNYAQLFLVEIPKSSFLSIQKYVERPLRKYARKIHIANIEDFISSTLLKNIDNVEGLCVQSTQNNTYNITIVSDNNFNKYQQTHFFHFHLKELK